MRRRRFVAGLLSGLAAAVGGCSGRIGGNERFDLVADAVQSSPSDLTPLRRESERLADLPIVRHHVTRAVRRRRKEREAARRPTATPTQTATATRTATPDEDGRTGTTRTPSDAPGPTGTADATTSPDPTSTRWPTTSATSTRWPATPAPTYQEPYERERYRHIEDRFQELPTVSLEPRGNPEERIALYVADRQFGIVVEVQLLVHYVE